MAEQTCPNCGKPYQIGDEVCRYCGLVFPFSTVVIPSGRLLQGRYEIRELIHTGGMGYIYLAKDKKLYDRDVIIKQVRESIKDESHRKKLEEEASSMAKLENPNIALIIDHFVENGYYFLVVERIVGKTLGEVFKERGGRFTEEEVLDWAITICDVVGYLHSRNVIHRDISPDNIMLTGNNILKFIDFGTSHEFRFYGTEGTAGIGKYGYTPPEQWRGKPEQRSDIFAIGATIYYLLTGYLPLSHEYITGQSPQKEDFNPEYPPIRTKNPEVSAGLESVLQKALQLEITKRFSSASEMRQALQKLKRVTQPGYKPVSKQKQFFLSHKYMFAAIAVVVVALVVAGIFIFRNSSSGYQSPFDGLYAAHVPVINYEQIRMSPFIQPVVQSKYVTQLPTIDGIWAEGEWDINLSKPVQYRLDDQVKNGELYVDFMNDDTNLYAAINISIPDLKEGMLEENDSWFQVQFFIDSNDDGVINSGEVYREIGKWYYEPDVNQHTLHDEARLIRGEVSGDSLSYASELPVGKGAASYNKNTNSYFYEFEIPLDSGDTGDLTAEPGDTISVKVQVIQMVIYEDACSEMSPCGWPEAGAFDTSTYAKLILATSGSPVGETEGETTEPDGPFVTVELVSTLDKNEISAGETFTVTITGNITCMRDINYPVSGLCVIPKITARNPTVGEIQLIVSNNITAESIPTRQGDRTSFTQVLLVRFPESAPTGSYNIYLNADEIKVDIGVWVGIAELFQLQEEFLGIVGYNGGEKSYKTVEGYVHDVSNKTPVTDAALYIRERIH